MFYGVPAIKRASDTVSVKKGSAKERIIASAITLFAQKGYDKTSVREIVSSAGVTKPVLYYHFQSKEGLLRAILSKAEAIQEDLMKTLLDSSGTAMERFFLLAEEIFQAVEKHQNLFRMIQCLVFGPPQGVPECDIQGFHGRLVAVIQRIYTEGLRKGEVIEADPEDVALLILSIIDFCLHLNHIHPDFSEAKRPERLLRLAFRGIAG